MTKNLIPILNKLLQALLIIIFFLYVYDLVNYLSAPGIYKFGTEVDGWRYNSATHYLGTLLFELFLISAVLGVGFSQLKINLLLLLRGVVFVLVVVQWFL